jgi:hypothetical protein
MKVVVILLFLTRMAFLNSEPIPSSLWNQTVLPDDVDKEKIYLKEGDMLVEKVNILLN